MKDISKSPDVSNSPLNQVTDGSFLISFFRFLLYLLSNSKLVSVDAFLVILIQSQENDIDQKCNSALSALKHRIILIMAYKLTSHLLSSISVTQAHTNFLVKCYCSDFFV